MTARLMASRWLLCGSHQGALQLNRPFDPYGVQPVAPLVPQVKYAAVIGFPDERNSSGNKPPGCIGSTVFAVMRSRLDLSLGWPGSRP
jgi:hypothetical protein